MRLPLAPGSRPGRESKERGAQEGDPRAPDPVRSLSAHIREFTLSLRQKFNIRVPKTAVNESPASMKPSMIHR